MLPRVIRELAQLARSLGWSDAELGHRLGFHNRSWLSGIRAGRPLTTLALSRILTTFPERPDVWEAVRYYLLHEFPRATVAGPEEATLLERLLPPVQRRLVDYVEHFAFEHLDGQGLWLDSQAPQRLGYAARYLLTALARRRRAVLRLLPNAVTPSRQELLVAQLVIVEHYDDAADSLRALLLERLSIGKPLVVTTPTRPSRLRALRSTRGLFGRLEYVSLDAPPRPSTSSPPARSTI